MKERGQLDPEKLDAFSLFLDVGNVTHCLYKDSERILGNTFGMCILQVLLINGIRNIFAAAYSYFYLLSHLILILVVFRILKL